MLLGASQGSLGRTYIVVHHTKQVKDVMIIQDVQFMYHAKKEISIIESVAVANKRKVLEFVRCHRVMVEEIEPALLR